MVASEVIAKLGVVSVAGGDLASINPADGREIGRLRQMGRSEYDTIVKRSLEVFLRWRMLPAPRRGEIVRQIAGELRAHKQALGALVTLEMGKILAEGEGEVQEMIDIADFAVGLSRQLYGKTMHSERPAHRMYEQWHPLGPIGVITAFNFPMAVWAWNAMIAAVCGDTVIWKPSSQTPLCAAAVDRICSRVLDQHGFGGVFQTAIGSNSVVGEGMLADSRLPLISFTGSSAVGRRVASTVGGRLGRTLLELGGNNGIIVMDDANLDLAVRAVVFGAVGTAGQRCTSTRRLFLQKGIARKLTQALTSAYQQVRIGDPSQPDTLMGPLVNRAAVVEMVRALDICRDQGGEIVFGGNPLGGCYMEPALVRSRSEMPIVKEEIFAPILHLIEFETLDEVIAWHNDVPQGLSSAIFTDSVAAAETFLSHRGSDCGIANVNIGTSGAEIGGAFGGEKETGGGREAGSDSWKAYMRRQTCTINWSKDLPLAQGIRFGE
ncbi:MAG TPA: aldehyde dehydrogenase family protein [Bryobacteraceae bacterium]|jgi:aldehyde dehydrogenase (NAD+)